MQKYDYIITGMGASGLMLAYHLVSDSFFDQKKILLIDKELKNQNDRTWSFWEIGDSIWDKVVSKKWSSIYFGSKDFSQTVSIEPYQYKTIRSKDFYDFVLLAVKNKPNVTIVQDDILAIKDEVRSVMVQTELQTYVGLKVFNSVLLSEIYKEQKHYPLLNQHFVGWFVKTTTASFDAKTATFMDFEVSQKGNTRFMYVLPTSQTEALFEYTLFSEELLAHQEYEDEIESYLKQKGITEYQILEKEKGCIPMTSYEFKNESSSNILHMGTAGGWTKASTGFTFNMSFKKVKKLVGFLKTQDDLSKFGKRTRFWYYDLLFLDVLHTKNEMGSVLFSKLFRKNKSQKILKFLDEETTFLEELKITTSLPWSLFLKAIWKRIF